MLFSQREGITIPRELNKDDMPEAVKNRFWNVLKRYIESQHGDRREMLIESIWDGFLSNDIDHLERNTNLFDGLYYYLDQIKSEYRDLPWYRVYDFIEYVLIESDDTYLRANIIKDFNQLFFDERVPYRIVDDRIVPQISIEEAEEVGVALSDERSEVRGHFRKALEFYSKRPDADYKNSIKESISAIEALARIYTNTPSGTLGVLSQQLNIHPALKKALKDLYGWTSDEGGIRHSETGKDFEFSAGESEARFMLVECSALVNYIVSKYEK